MQDKIRKLAKNQKIRFLAIGTINTIVDFSLLFLLAKVAHFPDIAANICSTTIALSISFFANRKYTFKSNGAKKREIPLFLAFTLFGLWILQSIVIGVFKHFWGDSDVVLLFAKVAATAVTLVWNYVTYKKFVFVIKEPNHEKNRD